MKKHLNIIFGIIGVVGFLFSVIVHFQTKTKSELSYFTLDPSYKIYDSDILNDSTSLNLYYGDSMKIMQDVYLSTFTLWNNGNTSIEKTDIRKSIQIEFPGIKSILNYKIIKENNKEVSGFVLEKKNSNTFDLDWKYFDPDYGFTLQIIYLGDSIIQSNVNGVIKKTDITNYTPPDKGKKGLKILLKGFSFLILLALAVYFIVIIKEPKRKPDQGSFSFVIKWLFYVILILLCLVLWLFLIGSSEILIERLLYGSGPPF